MIQFPRRRADTWIPFVHNQTVLAAAIAVLAMQLIHGLVLELAVGGFLVAANSVPIRHHVATEWISILARRNWFRVQSGLRLGRRPGPANPVHAFEIGATGTASVVRLDRGSGAIWFDDAGAQNRLCWLGVWIIPADSHLLLSSETEQRATFAQWGQLIAGLAGQSVRRLQFLSDVIVTAAAGPKETLRGLQAMDPSLDPDLAARYAAVADRVGSQVYDRRSYLVAEIGSAGPGQLSALKLGIDQIDRVIKGLIRNSRPLDADELVELIAGAFNPDAAFLRLLLGYHAANLRSLAPVRYTLPRSARRELVLPYHLSRTWVITEFPQMPVDQTWQLNLLGAIPSNIARYAISYTWSVADPSQALRRAEREANKAEMEVLARAAGRGNQRIMSREYAEIDAARETEADLTAGEAMLKGVATVTVTADSTEILDEAQTWLERQAGRSFLRLRSVDNRHDEGWASSLPLAIAPPYFEIHTLSTRQARTLYQAQIASPIAVPGILLGRDELSGAPFSWDPFELYAAQAITSPIAIVLGQVGTGKSTFSKLLALRGAGVHGRGFFALDPKGEYAGVAHSLGLPYLVLAPGEARINPLDFDSPSSRSAMLNILASAAMERNPYPEEAAALDRTAEILGAGATLATAVGVLREAPEALTHAMGTPTRDAAVERLIPVVAGLQRYLGAGPLGGLFDGETSIEVDPRGMVINLSAAFREPTLFRPVSSVVAFWLRNAISHLEQRSFLVVDEGWAVLDNLAPFLQGTAKLSRSYGVSLVLTMHGISDVLGAASAGTATAGKLQTVVDAVQNGFFFSNSASEIRAIAETFSLTDAERSILNLDNAPGNYRGLFLAVIGGRHYLCRTVLADADIASTDTDQAMVARRIAASSGAGSRSPKIFGTWATAGERR